MNTNDQAHVSRFKKAAEAYCNLLDSNPDDIDQWLEEVLSALAALYSAGHFLPEVSLEEDDLDIPDRLDVGDEEWSDLFEKLRGILGKSDEYWAVFDPSEPKESNQLPIFHSLADDLADVYRDVAPGLRAWDEDKDKYLKMIVFDWKCPLFGSHWGLHAVSAMRALHPLAFLRGIDTRVEPSASGKADKPLA